MQKEKKQHQKGFTVIELLIATTVFGVVLLIATAAIIGLSRQYYKALTQSKLQETARNVLDEVTNNVKFSTAPIIGPVTNGQITGYCLADRQYSYRLGRQLGQNNPTESRAVLLRGERCDLGNLPNAGNFEPTNGQTELIGENMRLSRLALTPIDQDTWQITVVVAYGGDDQLNNPNGPNPSCIGSTSGSSFCGVTEYTAIVVRRL